MCRIEFKVEKDHPRISCAGGRWKVSIPFNKQHDGSAEMCIRQAKWLHRQLKRLDIGYNALRVVDDKHCVIWRKRIKQ